MECKCVCILDYPEFVVGEIMASKLTAPNKHHCMDDIITMAKEEFSLGVEMERLEIEPIKVIKTIKEEIPFVNQAQHHQKKPFQLKSCTNSKCFCIQKKSRITSICKRKYTKILKEPVLKLLQNNDTNTVEQCELLSKKCVKSEDMISENLCALVDTCNQLKISSESSEEVSAASGQSNEAQWWKVNTTCSKPNREASNVQSQAGSCSQQALNPPCDVTIDELASYFETLVHIPKKMSSMAEMMYI